MSFASLGLRAGGVVAITVPLVLAGTVLVMLVAGIELQRISLGALVLALGILVDDAMIIIEMMAHKLQEGMERLQAAAYAYTATAFPMLTGTLVSVVGFLPIALARSQAGEYTGIDLLGHRDLAAALLGRGRPLHAVAGLRAASEADQRSARSIRHAVLQSPARIGRLERRASRVDPDRNACAVRRRRVRVHEGSAAVLSAVEPRRDSRRSVAPGRQQHRADRRRGETTRADPRRGSRRGELRNLRRHRIAAVLPVAGATAHDGESLGNRRDDAGHQGA